MTPSKRRPDGEGSLYQEADGRWRAVVVVGWTGEGKPIRVKRTAKTEREAAAKLRGILRERDAGKTSWAKPPTLAEWLDHWLTTIAGPTVRASTLTGYTTVTARAKEHFGPRTRLDRVTTEDIEAFYAAMRAGTTTLHGHPDPPHSPANVKFHHRVLSIAFRVAVRRGRITDNPCEDVHLPTGTRYRARILKPAEVQKFLTAADNHPHPVRWLFAFVHGWRQGEVLGLTWDRIDLDAGTVIRDRALARIPGAGLQLVPTKSEAAENTYPLPAAMVKGLRAVKQTQRGNRLALGSRWQGAVLPVDGGPPVPVDLVFTRRAGQAISREDDWAAWHAILKAAGLPPMRLHDARHSAATFMAALGVHPTVAQHLLGHAKIQTTLSVYTQADTDGVKAALDAMSAILDTRPTHTEAN